MQARRDTALPACTASLFRDVQRLAAPLWTGLLTVLVVLGGCQPSSDDTAETVTVTDDLARSVEVPTDIERVLPLAPNLTEIVYAAGAGWKLVAVTTADDFPAAVDTMPKVSALPVDFEAIVAREPDLILATDQVNTVRDSETFATLDMPVYFFSFRTLADVFTSIRTAGELLGTPSEARRAADSLETAIDLLQARTRHVPTADRPRVLVLIGDETLYAFGAGSYVHTLIDYAGGTSITADIETRAPVLSEEYVIQEKPDVIVGAFGAEYDADRLLELHPSWDIVPAIQNNRVYGMESALLLRPGPRLVAGAIKMASFLHPQLFETDSLLVQPSSSP